MKDSGERMTYESGMLREPDTDKPRFDLMIAEGIPYDAQLLTRFAVLLAEGAKKYKDRNWEVANSEAEVQRMKTSAFRHFMQWYTDEDDEDHASAVLFNILAAESTSYKISQSVV